MKLSEINYDALTDDLVEKLIYSYPEDDQKNGDIIFVFGSGSEILERAMKGIQLYWEGRGKKILFSGGKRKDGKTEASLMKEIAIRESIPEEDILLEEQSTNTTENILCSLLILERKMGLGSISHIVAVTNPAHMMRVMLTLKHYLPKWIECSYAPLNYHKAAKEVWKCDLKVKEKVWTEAKSMIHYAQTNRIEDFFFDEV